MFRTYIILFLFCITSCSKKSSEFIPEIELHKVTVMNFPVDSLTNIKSWYFDVFEDKDKEWLVFQSEKPSIKFYDISKENLEFDITFDQIGPDGVGSINGFHVKSLDSIYLLNVAEMRIFLINNLGKVLNEFYLLKPNNKYPDGSRSSPTIISGSPAINYNNILHFAARPDTGPTSEETYRSGNVEFAIDPTNGNYDLKFNYPKIYTIKNYGNFWGKIFRVKTEDNRIAYSFAADPNIYVTDYKYTEAFNAETAIFNKPIPYKDISQMRKNNLLSTMYGGIFYDKYRRLYYRIVTGGIEEFSENHVFREIYDAKPISIIILDEEFKKIGETLLPSKAHDPLGAFVGKEGLFISNSNFENFSLKEDTLSFTVYAPRNIK